MDNKEQLRCFVFAAIQHCHGFFLGEVGQYALVATVGQKDFEDMVEAVLVSFIPVVVIQILTVSCLNEKSPCDLRHQGRVIYNKKSRAVAEHPSVTVRLI